MISAAGTCSTCTHPLSEACDVGGCCPLAGALLYSAEGGSPSHFSLFVTLLGDIYATQAYVKVTGSVHVRQGTSESLLWSLVLLDSVVGFLRSFIFTKPPTASVHCSLQHADLCPCCTGRDLCSRGLRQGDRRCGCVHSHLWSRSHQPGDWPG